MRPNVFQNNYLYNKSDNEMYKLHILLSYVNILIKNVIVDSTASVV
jgi:hypothetical protein